MSIVPRDFFGDQTLANTFPQDLWNRFFSPDSWNDHPFISELFPFAFSSLSSARTLPYTELAVETEGSVATRFDCKEVPEAHIFIADLPGAKKEEVKVDVEEDAWVLQISGESGGGGRFKWRFRLPENAKLRLVTSSMENGVLTVVVPKVEFSPRAPRNVRSIEISGSVANKFGRTKTFQLAADLDSYTVMIRYLVDMYAKCGEIKCAENVFNESTDGNVASWTSLIVGYVQNDCVEEEVILFNKMRDGLVAGNQFTLGSLVTGWGRLGALYPGKWLHGFVIKNGTLLDMYVKGGNTIDACSVFACLSEADLFSWTAMVVGYM
ncbi:hypothetical protein Nepgr_023240 [Nepenthes gracilis]|uniref:SHSP domain-containing protein n=1 Tax=Nepenthes gracilis TaxID=150966 RepID=A0AAD3T1P5_NEPGR|nr:hypothetical protein Nepgr_023240 [Nepenthes gracilis]